MSFKQRSETFSQERSTEGEVNAVVEFWKAVENKAKELTTNIPFYAAKFDAYRCIDILPKLKVDINPYNLQGIKPIHIAAAANSVNALRAFINNGINVDETSTVKTTLHDNMALTPLHVAASERKKEAVNALLELGADRNKTVTTENPEHHRYEGYTAAHCCISQFISHPALPEDYVSACQFDEDGNMFNKQYPKDMRQREYFFQIENIDENRQPITDFITFLDENKFSLGEKSFHGETIVSMLTEKNNTELVDFIKGRLQSKISPELHYLVDTKKDILTAVKKDDVESLEPLLTEWLLPESQTSLKFISNLLLTDVEKNSLDLPFVAAQFNSSGSILLLNKMGISCEHPNVML